MWYTISGVWPELWFMPGMLTVVRGVCYKKYVALPQSGEYRGWLHINKIGGGHFNSVELDMNFMQIIEKQIEKSLILFK